MRDITVQVITEKEAGIIRLLTAVGIPRRHSLILVFLADTKEVPSRNIERGTDLRQPEVSLVMKDLVNRGWIIYRTDTTHTKGRPVRLYRLAIPFEKILKEIEVEKRKDAEKTLTLLKKVREFE